MLRVHLEGNTGARIGRIGKNLRGLAFCRSIAVSPDSNHHSSELRVLYPMNMVLVASINGDNSAFPDDSFILRRTAALVLT
jgi:hypothetical protein